MIEADRENFTKLMAILAEVYGECSVLKIQAYWMALKELPYPDVQAAAFRCLRTRQSKDGFPAPWPTPADLIALMWNSQDSVPDESARPGRLALPKPRADSEKPRGSLPGMGLVAQALIQDILEHRLMVREAIEQMWALDEQFPGLGWGRSATELALERERKAERGLVYVNGFWMDPKRLPAHVAQGLTPETRAELEAEHRLVRERLQTRGFAF